MGDMSVPLESLFCALQNKEYFDIFLQPQIMSRSSAKLIIGNKDLENWIAEDITNIIVIFSYL